MWNIYLLNVEFCAAHLSKYLRTTDIAPNTHRGAAKQLRGDWLSSNDTHAQRLTWNKSKRKTMLQRVCFTVYILTVMRIEYYGTAWGRRDPYRLPLYSVWESRPGETFNISPRRWEREILSATKRGACLRRMLSIFCSANFTRTKLRSVLTERSCSITRKNTIRKGEGM